MARSIQLSGGTLPTLSREQAAKLGGKAPLGARPGELLPPADLPGERDPHAGWGGEGKGEGHLGEKPREHRTKVGTQAFTLKEAPGNGTPFYAPEPDARPQARGLWSRITGK